MKRQEIDLLYMEKKRKGLTNKSLAEAIGCSESLISRYFGHSCNLSHEKEIKLKKLIEQAKEFRYLRVEIED